MPDFDSNVKKNAKKHINQIKNTIDSNPYNEADLAKNKQSEEHRRATKLKNIQTQLNRISEQLQKLNTLTDELYKDDVYVREYEDANTQGQVRDEESFKRVLSEDDYSALLKEYDDTAKVIQGVVSNLSFAPMKKDGTPGKSVLDSSPQIKEMLNQIQNTVNSDYLAIRDFKNKKEPFTMEDIFEKSRGINVDLGDRKIKSVGANLSQRTPFTYSTTGGKKVSGVFTPKTIYAPETDFNDTFTKGKELNAEFGDLMDTVRETYFHLNSNRVQLNNVKIFSDYLSKGIPEQKFKNTEAQFIEKIESFSNEIKDRYPDLSKSINDKLDAAKKNPDFMKHAEFYNKRLRSIGSQMGMNNCANISIGSRIDSRNTAMSVVASLLGKSKLVAKSSSMTITMNGQEIEGSFMKVAKGNDYNHPTQESGSYTAENFMTNGISSFSDLMVLDYLCGNVDRHAANFMYQFDTSDPDPTKHKFIGVQGFDNDCSFGEVAPIPQGDNGEARRGTKVANQMNSIEGIQVISKSMAGAIINISSGQFKFQLHGLGLSEKQIDAVGARFEKLQGAINEGLRFYVDKNKRQFIDQPNGIKPGILKIVADNQFKNLDLNELAKYKGGSYSFLTNYGDRMREKLKDGPSSANLNPEEVNKAIGYTISDKETKKFEKQLQDMKDATSKLRGTSPEFTKLQDKIQSYVGFCKKNEGVTLTPKEFEMRQKLLRNIVSASTDYLDHKGIINKAENKKVDPQPKLNGYEERRVGLVSKFAAECVNMNESSKALYEGLTAEDKNKILAKKENDLNKNKAKAISQLRSAEKKLDADGDIKSNERIFTKSGKKDAPSI